MGPGQEGGYPSFLSLQLSQTGEPDGTFPQCRALAFSKSPSPRLRPMADAYECIRQASVGLGWKEKDGAGLPQLEPQLCFENASSL